MRMVAKEAVITVISRVNITIGSVANVLTISIVALRLSGNILWNQGAPSHDHRKRESLFQAVFYNLAIVEDGGWRGWYTLM